jgi:hypothetical protein
MVRYLRSLKVLAFVVLAGAVVFAAEASQAVAESFLADDEAQMAALVNQHRAGVGLSSLVHNDALRTIARRQAQRMVVAGYIYHNPDLRSEANAAVPSWLLLGENVGVGPSVEMVEEAFLNSAKHRENIETARFNNVGVGAMASQDGGLYFTQNFADLRTAPAAAAAAAPGSTPPVVRVPVRARSAKAASTPAPTPAPTPVISPTPAPSPAVLGGKAVRANASLLEGLAAMIAHFFEKLAFWRTG